MRRIIKRIKKANPWLHIMVFELVLACGIWFIVAFSNGAYPTAPTNINIIDSSRREPTSGVGIPVIAGNISEIIINGTTQTMSWAGFWGNITGTIVLDDLNNYTLFEWDLVNPSGEVYAATLSPIDWNNVECGNQTTMNYWETQSGMLSNDGDGINETFLESYDHTPFYTASTLFNEGDCPATSLYENDAPGDSFQEVVIWDRTNSHMVFVALVAQGERTGFNGEQTQFEIMAPENGSAANTDLTTYYFWVELE